MCVIVHLPKKVTLSKKVLQACYENNPDGFGIMSALPEGLQVARSVGNFDQFLKEWREFNPEHTRAIHFRWKTHGLINIPNCHPFMVSPDLYMMHNGMIETCEVDRDMSDTWHFVEHDLKPILEQYPGMILDQEIMTLVEEVTSSSRLLFMDKEGRVVRTNVSEWAKDHGCYFSNSHGYKANYRTNKITYKKNGESWDGENYAGYGYTGNYNYGGDYSGAYGSYRKASNGDIMHTTPSGQTINIGKPESRGLGTSEGKYSDLTPYGKGEDITEESDLVSYDTEDGAYYERTVRSALDGEYSDDEEFFEGKNPTLEQLAEMDQDELGDWVFKNPDAAADLIGMLLSSTRVAAA